MKYYRHVNWDYLDWATFFGFIARPEPIIHQLYSEPLQKFRLAARGHGKIIPPTEHRARVESHFDPATRRLVLYDQLNPAYAKYYTEAEVRRLLADAGFEDVRLYHRHGYSWAAIGRKAGTGA
jgi:hypothetical protein